MSRAPDELARVRSELELRLRSQDADPALLVSPLIPFGDGHSGFTYSTTLTSTRTGERACVVRLSPPGARIAGPADIGRQGCLMRQLGAAGVPVPAVIAYDSAPVLAGRSFMLVERVAGHGWSAALEEHTHAEVAATAISTLRQLQAVEIRRVSSCLGALLSYGPREELGRWLPLLERADGSTGARARELARLLDAAAPQPTVPVVVHGDYHYGNLVFRDGAPAAILDWELAAVGERLVDVGSLIVASLRRRYAPEPNSAGNIGISPEALLGLYAGDAAEAPWFVALNCLKYAAIIAYNLALHRSGRRLDPEYERLVVTLSRLVDDGVEILGDGLTAACLHDAAVANGAP